MHSGLDLIAAIMTLFAVRIADKPPDDEHHWGHGKVENLSALFEAVLLVLTCVWIIYEAVERLTSHDVAITVNFWSFFVVILSIIVDLSRSRALRKVAKKYKSQALEADALHFSTDILSSFVVLIGLVATVFHYKFADSISALIVAIIVSIVTFRLGKRAIDVLLDRAPTEINHLVADTVSSVNGVKYFHDLKVRTSGPDTFVVLTIHVQPGLTIEDAHSISESVEEEIRKKIGDCEVHVHAEPDENL
jgi:cation diffusion facilitator family transporter